MTLSPIDTRSTALKLMKTTRRAWQIAEAEPAWPARGRCDGKDAFAWPVGGAGLADRMDQGVERFLRSQE